MEKDAKIFVAGHNGLVGSAIYNALIQQGYKQLLTCTRAELDLRDSAAVQAWFVAKQPQYVFLAAAKVGGVWANKIFPADFLLENLQIQNNVLQAAHQSGVQKLLFMASACIYPTECPQPMPEAAIHTGKLDPSTQPYAIAKLAGIELCAAMRRQYGCNFISVVPTNLYGINDNWDLATSHVLPALLRKIHTAKQENQSVVEVWGDGSPRREFMLNEDLADACVFLMQHYEEEGPINIGSGEEITIRELAETIRAVVGWQGEYAFDTSKPNGNPRRLTDSSRLRALGWQPKHNLATGIRYVYENVFLKADSQRLLQPRGL